MAKLTPNQIEALIDIIRRQSVTFIGSVLGSEYLSDKDKQLLKKAGVDIRSLYQFNNDPIFLNYQLGMLSKILKDNTARDLSYSELKRMVQSGQYIDLTSREKLILNSVKTQTLTSIKSKQSKIFQDINEIINQPGREVQESFIRDQIIEGLKSRKQVKEISREISRKTGDWGRDFDRIVQYVCHQAFSEGRAAILKRKYGDDARVYVKVFDGACKHCIKLYLTNGSGSKPRTFTLKELESNGNNIGRKVAQWLPVIPPMHPYCRCNLMEEEDQKKKKIERPKVKVTIGKKEYLV